MSAETMGGRRGTAAAGQSLQHAVWRLLGPVLFIAIFLFFWVGLEAFPDLADPSVLLPNTGGDSANQIAALGLSALALLYVAQNDPRRFLLVVSPALIVLFAWMVACALLSGEAAMALRKLVLAGLILLQATALLLIPDDRRQFAVLLSVGIGIALTMSYLGALFIPHRAIHQVTELIEPQLAGDWRGAFAHKNVAGAACAMAIIIALFVRRALDPRVGWTLLVAAGVFLALSGSKTPMGILPLSLAISWLLLRMRSTGKRLFLVLGGVFTVNLLTVGSVVLPPVRAFNELFMQDASFTNRNSIWQFALSTLSERPLTGFGFQAFWGTSGAINNASSIETWAVKATSAHNGYLDILLYAGIPGLILFAFWYLAQPLRDLMQAEQWGADQVLTTLFVRIWVFTVLSGCLESVYFVGGGPVWITALIGVLGLRLQARARARIAGGERTA